MEDKNEEMLLERNLTYTNQGVLIGHRSTCSRCSYSTYEQLPATGHTWSDWVKKTGLVHAHTCTVCGAEEEADHNIPSGSVTCTDCGADIIN